MNVVIRLAVIVLVWVNAELGNAAYAQPATRRPELEVQTGHQHQVDHAVFSADSRLVATTDLRGSIRIWDAATGKQLRALSGRAERISRLAFSPDGRWLVSAGASREPTSVLVKIWEVDTGRELHRLVGHQDDVKDLAFSPDGGLLATAGGDVRVWDTKSGRQTERIEAAAQTTLAFSPDGRVLAIREPPRVRLWALGRGELVAFALGNFYGPRSVAFREDGARLAVPDGDRLKIIDPVRRARTAEIPFQQESQILGFADAHCVVRSREAYEIWDISTGRRLRTIAPREGSLDGPYHVLSPDRRRLAVLNRPGVGAVTVRDIGWNRPPIELGGRVDAAGAVAFSPDGSLLAAQAGGRFWIWDLQMGKPRVYGGGSELELLAFSGDGRGIISGDLLWNLIHWDVASGRARNTMALKHDKTTVTHACSQDGHWCASGQQGRVDIWEIEAWRLFRTFQTGVVRGVAISDDGSWVAAARVPTDIDLWNRETGQHRLLAGHGVDVSRVAFAPGGRLLASADFGGMVRLWDLASGRQLKVLDSGQVDGVTSLAFSPDGRTLASGGADHSIRLWDLGTDRLRHVLSGHAGWVAKLAFSPNGAVLASGSGDGTARLWDVGRGLELALLTAAKDRPDWLVATPEGVFDGSATLVAWRVGTSAHPPDQYLSDFFRPGLLAAVWRGKSPIPGTGWQNSPLPPEVRIMRTSATIVRQARLDVRVRAQGVVSEVRLYQNLAPVATKAGPPITSPEYAFAVDLVPGENEIRAVTVSPGGVASHPDAIRIFYDVSGPGNP